MTSLDQFKVGFLTECDELLVEMESLLVGLTPETTSRDMLDAIFRCAHSIKGGSGAFGLDFITNFTHVLEALLDEMREDRVETSSEAVDVLLKSVDVVTQMVEAAKNNEVPAQDLGADVLAELKQRAAAGAVPAEIEVEEDNSFGLFADEEEAPTAEVSDGGQHWWQIQFSAHENLFISGNDPIFLLRELNGFGDMEVTAFSHRVPSLDQLDPTMCYLGWNIHLHTDKSEADIKEVFEFVEDECDLSITQTPAPQADTIPTKQEISDAPQKIAATKPEEKKPAFMRRASDAAGTVNASIRVDISKVDRLVNMVGELVITEAMIKAQVNTLPSEQFAALMRGVDELSQHTRELQEAVMSVRMQAVKSIFSRMPRIVRDLSSQLEKNIVLNTEGENTEVDKTVIEQLGDPLTHMIRNSIDHGIEKPQERVAKGKPEQGTIVLSARHQSGRIIIQITDDGAGINRERVLSKAKEKGLVAEHAELTGEQIDNLVFAAGFSTAETVTNVSGRGVGMDVVRRNIEALDGTVSVRTDPGKGSVFTVSLPLTLAILDGMIVRVGQESYIIPIISIIETLRPRKEEVRHVEGHSDVINVRGEFIPLIYLHDVFSINSAQPDASKALVVLVETNREKLGVVVDELIGQQQVVIKSLEDNTDPIEGVSGATILGDGRVSLILEIAQLRDLAVKLDENKRTIARAA